MFSISHVRRPASLVVLAWLWCGFAAAQTPTVLWNQAYGGSSYEHLTDAHPTADGGYLLSGNSGSGASGNKTTPQPGFWVVKLAADGTKQWERTHVLGTAVFSTRLCPTADGGYLLSGTKISAATDDDYWVMKLDANGTQQWSRTVGGSRSDRLKAVAQTPDGGFVLGGTSYSEVSGDKTTPARGYGDYWVVRLSPTGTVLWDRTMGGSETDDCLTITPTTDGGCLAGGYAWSGISGDKTEAIRGSVDYWVVKLTANGSKQWDRTYGGNITDILTQVRQTPDGGYVLGGFSESDQSGDRTQPKRGLSDYWVVKLNAAGNKEWDSSYGSTGQDELRYLALTPDGGYLLGGDAWGPASFEKTETGWGFFDYWVVRLDGQGKRLWDRTLGTPGGDQIGGVLQAADGSVLVAGSSDGQVAGTRTAPNWGEADFWAVKLAATAPPVPLVTIRGDSLLCNQPLLLTATTSVPAASYRWNTGATTPAISVAQLGTYSVAVTFPGGQVVTSQKTIKAFEPSLRITGDSVLCAGGSTRLAAVTPAATGYLWSTGDSTAAITVRQPGTYTVTAYYGVACSATRQMVVRTPGVRISGGTTVCGGGNVTLTAAAPGASRVLWSTGASTPSLTVTQAGAYTVTATFPSGCVATATHTVTSPPTSIRITGDTLLCPGASAQLAAVAPGAVSYAWSTGATTASISVTQPGTYSVVAAYGSGCTNRAQLMVAPAPTVASFSLGADTTLCEGQTTVLRVPAAVAAGSGYRWSDGSRSSTLSVTQPGIYSLTLTTACGTYTAIRRVAWAACAPPPNVITPNGDQLNEHWVLQGLPTGQYSVEVYNRWGRCVYTASPYRNNWGPEAAAGAYYYILRHTTTGQTYKGWLTVIR